MQIITATAQSYSLINNLELRAVKVITHENIKRQYHYER